MPRQDPGQGNVCGRESDRAKTRIREMLDAGDSRTSIENTIATDFMVHPRTVKGWVADIRRDRLAERSSLDPRDREDSRVELLTGWFDRRTKYRDLADLATDPPDVDEGVPGTPRPAVACKYETVAEKYDTKIARALCVFDTPPEEQLGNDAIREMLINSLCRQMHRCGVHELAKLKGAVNGAYQALADARRGDFIAPRVDDGEPEAPDPTDISGVK